MSVLCENTDCKFNDDIMYEPDKHYCRFKKLNPHTDIKINENGVCETFELGGDDNQ